MSAEQRMAHEMSAKKMSEERASAKKTSGEKAGARRRCINDTLSGSHGEATDGVRCARCAAVHRQGAASRVDADAPLAPEIGAGAGGQAGEAGASERLLTLETQVSADLVDGLEWVRDATGRASLAEVLRDSAELAHLIVHVMATRGARLFIGERRDSAIQILVPHLERASGRLRRIRVRASSAGAGASGAVAPAGGGSGSAAGLGALLATGSASSPRTTTATGLASRSTANPPGENSKTGAGSTAPCASPASAVANARASSEVASMRRTTLLALESGTALSTGEIVDFVTRVLPSAKRTSITAALHGFKRKEYVIVDSKTPRTAGTRYAITPAGRRWLRETRSVIASDPVSGSPR